MPDETGPDRSTLLRSLPILISIVIGDYVIFRLLPGVDTSAQRSLRYAPLLGISVVLFLLGLALSWRPSRKQPAPTPILFATSTTSRTLIRLYAGVLVFGVAASLFFAYLVGKALVFRLDHESVWKDTVTYAAGAEVPLSSTEFWAGERSFTLPLLYKLLDVDQASLSRQSRMRRISSFQFILGVLSWSTLAVVTGRLIKSRWLNILGFGVILALGLTLDVSLWDRILLTESASTSLLVLLVSLALLGLKYRDTLGRHGAWWKIPYWIGIGGLCVLYSFTRDTNAYFLAACALAILVGMAFRRLRRHPSSAPWIFFSIFLLALFFVQSKTADQGRRWVLPYFNILHMRIFPDETARSFFQAAGMPADDVTFNILKLDRRPFFQSLEYNFGAQPLIDWVEAKGKGTYLRYLLSQPVATFMQPINRARNLISPLSTEYRADDYSVPIWLSLFSRVFFPLPLAIVFGWLGSVIVVTCLLGRVQSLRTEWIVPALLLLTAFPMVFVVWYGDAIEVERHAFQISVQVRLALWMLTVFLADAWLVRLRSGAVEGA